VRLLRRKPRTFDIQVQDLLLHVTAPEDVEEEARAAALSFWEQLQAYSLQHPEFRSKRPIPVPRDAPVIVREMCAAAARAGVGPMYAFRGAVADQVGRFLARGLPEVSVRCGGDHFIVSRRRMKLTVHRRAAGPIAVVVQPRREGVGVCTTLGRGRAALGADGLAVLATSCMLADAAAAGVEALLPKEGGLEAALRYLREVPGVLGGLVILDERIGVSGGVELAA
jgi:ApbE superfamily uncharacterized protein (UPF0280 family)